VDTGKHMRACKRCKLLKTLEQVRGCVLLCAHVAFGGATPATRHWPVARLVRRGFTGLGAVMEAGSGGH
jgi:hypothetical protein